MSRQRNGSTEEQVVEGLAAENFAVEGMVGEATEFLWEQVS